MKKQTGFTLVEILIACMLGIVLLVALIQSFLTLKHTIKTQTVYDAMQENGRFAVFLLNRVIHNAGYNACDPANQFVLGGFSAKQVPASWRITPKPDTDVLIAGQCQLVGKTEQFVKTAYYVAKTSVGSMGLFAKRETKRRQELVTNVNTMNINFGVSDGENIISYQSSGTINDWQRVKSVDIHLVLTDAKQKITKDWHTYVALR